MLGCSFQINPVLNRPPPVGNRFVLSCNKPYSTSSTLVFKRFEQILKVSVCLVLSCNLPLLRDIETCVQQFWTLSDIFSLKNCSPPPSLAQGFKTCCHSHARVLAKFLLRMSGLKDSRRCESLIPCFIKFAYFYKYLVSFWQNLAACCLVHITWCVYWTVTFNRTFGLPCVLWLCLYLLGFACLCSSWLGWAWLGFKRQSGFSQRPFETKMRKKTFSGVP